METAQDFMSDYAWDPEAILALCAAAEDHLLEMLNIEVQVQVRLFVCVLVCICHVRVHLRLKCPCHQLSPLESTITIRA